MAVIILTDFSLLLNRLVSRARFPIAATAWVFGFGQITLAAFCRFPGNCGERKLKDLKISAKYNQFMRQRRDELGPLLLYALVAWSLLNQQLKNNHNNGEFYDG